MGPWHHRWMTAEEGSPNRHETGPVQVRHVSSAMILALVCVGQFMVVLDSTGHP